LSTIAYNAPMILLNPLNGRAAARWMDSSGVPWIAPVALWQADRKAKLCIGQLSFGKVKNSEVLITPEARLEVVELQPP
jgi:hypothetical protein